MFFFLSAYSLAGREIDYVPFLKDRVLKLYAKFAFFVLIMALFSKSFGVIRAVKSLTFIEFFQKGGGAFLWFIPAILIFYAVYPLFLKWNSRFKVIWVLLIWLTGSVFAEHVLSYTAVFIFTNRIPVILAGYLFKTYCTKNNNLRRSFIVLIPLGVLLLHMYGFNVRLNFPIKDMFYVLAIPTVLGLVTLSSYVKKYAVTESLGSITLELYAVQMIFGQRILIWAYNVFNKNALLTNIFVTGVMLLLAYIISYVIKRGERLIIK